MSGSFITSLVQQAFKVLPTVDASLVQSSIYTQGGQATYNPTTGVVTNTSSTKTFNGVFTKFGEDEKDSQVVVATDSRLLIAALDLGNIVPNHTDTVSSTDAFGNVTKWKVMRVMGVPTSGFWKLHVRRV